MAKKLALFLFISTGLSSLAFAEKQTEDPIIDACIAQEVKHADDSQSIGEIRQLCQNKEYSLFEERFVLEESAESNPFAILPHKPTYFLPFSYSKVNSAPYEKEIGDHELSDTEIKFQVSLKYIAAKDWLIDDLNVELALTATSWWQAYNTDISTPFRETMYEPEIMFTYQKPLSIFGLTADRSYISLNHQSNGQAGQLSRSWNRVIGGVVFNSGDFIWGVQAWWRIPEEQKSDEFDPTGDDNPNIEDYLGHGEFVALWQIAEGHNIDMELRNNLSSDNKGSVLLGWSFPLTNHLRGYVQYFNGYGESLIYYNHHSERLGIGVKLTDWL